MRFLAIVLLRRLFILHHSSLFKYRLDPFDYHYHYYLCIFFYTFDLFSDQSYGIEISRDSCIVACIMSGGPAPAQRDVRLKGSRTAGVRGGNTGRYVRYIPYEQLHTVGVRYCHEDATQTLHSDDNKLLL